jgi:hypothetical protein
LIAIKSSGLGAIIVGDDLLLTDCADFVFFGGWDFLAPFSGWDVFMGLRF